MSAKQKIHVSDNTNFHEKSHRERQPESGKNVANSADMKKEHEVKEAKDPVEDDKKRYDELYEKYIRLYSEFENFRRRTNLERVEVIQQANRDLLQSLLPVVDDFERALSVLRSTEGNEAAINGIELIYNKFANILQNIGVTEIPATGQPFDPEVHDAITQIPAPSADLKGKVVDVVQKGYFLKDKILRHAQVVVGE